MTETTPEPATNADAASPTAEAGDEDVAQSFMQQTTQREWLLIQKALDAKKDEIAEDMTRLLLAMAWVKGKREHGGASWDTYLDMTDDQITAYLGITDDDVAELAGDDEDRAPGASEADPNGLIASGTDSEPDSVLPPA